VLTRPDIAALVQSRAAAAEPQVTQSGPPGAAAPFFSLALAWIVARLARARRALRRGRVRLRHAYALVRAGVAVVRSRWRYGAVALLIGVATAGLCRWLGPDLAAVFGGIGIGVSALLLTAVVPGRSEPSAPAVGPIPPDPAELPTD
jgi:hypothetical protein